jgi:dimethylamine corrinoid protein
MLTSAGFQVHDIGVDTPPESFVDKIKETDAKILALSALLTTATGSIAEVINLMTEVGIRSRVKVIAGGAAVTKELAKQLGADAYAEDAVEAVKVCRKLLREAV